MTTSIDDHPFHLVKEVHSLHKNIPPLEVIIASEKNRLKFLEQQKEEKNSVLEAHKSELLEINQQINQSEVDLSKTEAHLKNMEEQLNSSKDPSVIQASIDKEKEKIDQLENSMIALIDNAQGIQKKIEQINSFLSGFKETYKKIQAEVEEKTKVEQKKIDLIHEEISDVMKNIPSLYITAYQSALKHTGPGKALTYLSQGKCEHCRFVIGRNFEQSIDKGEVIEHCSSCQRLILPHFTRE